jgi:hypothetical protein
MKMLKELTIFRPKASCKDIVGSPKFVFVEKGTGGGGEGWKYGVSVWINPAKTLSELRNAYW